MAVGANQPFVPSGTLTLACSTTTATGVLVGGGETLLVYNATTGIAFIRFSATAALVTDMPVPPGAQMLLGLGTYATNVAAILSAGTGNVYFTRGTGSAIA